jgi:AGZA family xanthine/uracil permease-like MFS transporter
VRYNLVSLQFLAKPVQVGSLTKHHRYRIISIHQLWIFLVIGRGRVNTVSVGMGDNMAASRYHWVRIGDVNAFFGLMLDNMSDLVIMAGILIGVFGFPQEIVLYGMIPGTAVSVLIGDLFYTYLAIRLARETGRDDVTAMPLGLDTPSTFGLAFGIIGPAYLKFKDPILVWKITMAIIILMGIIKILGAWIGPTIRRIVPRAGLLGSIAAVAMMLIAFFPSLKVFSDPLVGFVSLGIILMTLIGRLRFPLRVPGALAAVLIGTTIYYLLHFTGISPIPAEHLPSLHMAFNLPLPTLGFLEGLPIALKYLPVAAPFAIAIVVGGIDVTESAAAAGDEYNSRTILLADGVGTIVAGLCGGVVQSTPYIGHPAYKDMGGRAGYTLATAIFIGFGGILGYLSFFVHLLPEAAVAPILIFIGLEITAQAYEATPGRHAKAVAMAFIPVIANLLFIEIGSILSHLGKTAADLSGEVATTYRTILMLGNGFILSSLLWGAAVAKIIDQQLKTAAYFLGTAGIFSLFGIIHSPLASGEIFLPWLISSSAPYRFFLGYMVTALMLLFLDGSTNKNTAK